MAPAIEEARSELHLRWRRGAFVRRDFRHLLFASKRRLRPTPSAANGAADIGTAAATNGPNPTAPAANGAADTGSAPTTSAPPAANSLPEKGALAFPL
jgi:hypothetical protein